LAEEMLAADEPEEDADEESAIAGICGIGSGAGAAVVELLVE